MKDEKYQELGRLYDVKPAIDLDSSLKEESASESLNKKIKDIEEKLRETLTKKESKRGYEQSQINEQIKTITDVLKGKINGLKALEEKIEQELEKKIEQENIDQQTTKKPDQNLVEQPLQLQKNSQDKQQSFQDKIKALAANLMTNKNTENNHGLKNEEELETLQKAFRKLSSEDKQRVMNGQFSEIKITATTTDSIRKGLGNKGISTADAQALFSNLTQEKFNTFHEARQARKDGHKTKWQEKINQVRNNTGLQLL